MTTFVRLVTALALGLLTRHVTVHAGRALASRTRLRIPPLCGYALAGCTAGLLKLALASWTDLSGLVVWAAFGAAWGVVAGLVLPLGRRRGNGAAEALASSPGPADPT
jgi:predicted Kef-type K+ transport protein